MADARPITTGAKRRARPLKTVTFTLDDLAAGLVARQVLESEIERLISILDAADPDPDLEETGDLEPSLGAQAPGAACDAELDDSDSEFTLGSLDRQVDQARWASGQNTDAELDRADNEPSLGSPAGALVDQRHWAEGKDREPEPDDDDGDEHDRNGDEYDGSMAEDDWAWDGNRPAPTMSDTERLEVVAIGERLDELAQDRCRLSAGWRV